MLYHQCVDLVPVHIAVLTIANGAGEDHSASATIAEQAKAAGHAIIDEATVKDAEAAIRDQLVRWIAEPTIDVVVVAASVESESASAALAPLVMQTLPGFTDLFRWLTFQEIGASAMLSAAEAALCESTFVFVLPAHEVAVRAAMDKLILPQLDARTRPKNLVTQMPRLKQEAKRVQALPQAVPTPVAAEKTAAGSGVTPKPPARAGTRTANTIPRKPDDPPTKRIDIANLEKQIALSNVNEAQTKEVNIGARHDAETKVVDMSAHQAKTRVVDMTGRVLPRVPPGADELAVDDDDALTFEPPTSAAVAKATGSAATGSVTTGSVPTGSPPPSSVPSPSSVSPPSTPLPSSLPPLPSIKKPAATASPAKPSTAAPIKTPPPVSVPSFSTPIARTPTTPPIARTPTAPPTSPLPTPTAPPPTPITPVARKEAITPVSPASQVIAERDRAITPVRPMPVVPLEALAVAADTPSNDTDTDTPSAGGTSEVEDATAGDPPESRAAADVAKPVTPAAVEASPPRPRPRAPTPPPPPPMRAEKADKRATDAPATGAPATDFDAVDAPLSAALTQPAVKRKPTQPPPIDPIAQVTAKPLGVVDLPEGDFVYPVNRRGGALFLKLLAAAAVLGLGFFAVVTLFPRDRHDVQTAAATPAPLASASPPGSAAATPPAVSDTTTATATAEGSGVSDGASAGSGREGDDGIDSEAIELEPAQVATSGRKPSKTRPGGAHATTGSNASGAAKRPDRDDASTQGAGASSGDGKPASDAAHTATGVGKPEPASDPSCDEVSCVLSKYDRPCCERYRPAGGFTPTTGATPEELDKRLVKAGVEKIKPRVVECGEQAGVTGTVKLAVSVDGDGTVKNVSVTESPTPALGQCVAGAMRKAKFARTVKGGEFIYPFVF